MASLTNAEKVLKLAEQAERLEKLINPLGKFNKQFGYLNKFEHLNKANDLVRRITPAWFDNPALTAIQRIATLYQPSRDLYNMTKGLSAFNRLAGVALPSGLLQQSAILDLVQKDFFHNWNAAAKIADQLRMPAKIEQLQARFGNLFAQLAEASAETHTEEEAASTASISADLLAIGNEIIASQRVSAEATSKLAAIAERYEQQAIATAAKATTETEEARDTRRATQQSLTIQIYAIVVSALVTILAALLPIYLARHPDPADQAVTQQQFADWQAQLATFVTHAAAPIQAERVALRSVQVRANPRQTAEVVGQLRKNILASVWATQGKWAQISYLDVDGLPTQGWVRRNSLGWLPPSQSAGSEPRSVLQRRRR